MLFLSKTLLLSLVIILSACQNSLNIRPSNSALLPVVYQSHCLSQATNSSPQIKLGYGSGLTLNEAKQHAYKDIAEQLGVTVKTKTRTQVIKKQSDVKQSYQNQVDTFAQAELDDLSIECLDKQDPSGTIHILLGYDLRPLDVRIADKLIDAIAYVPGTIQLTGPSFLTHSKLARDVKNTLLSRSGSKPLKAEIKIRRHKNQWQWIIAEQPFYLSNNQLHLTINWNTLNKGGTELSAITTKNKSLPPIIKTETEFRLLVTTQQKGYLQLLSIYENGEIDVVRNDIKTRASQKHLFPETQGVFEAGLLEADKTATDVYLAIVTQQPLSKTGLLSPDGISNGNQFYLMAFLNLLQKHNNPASTRLITISPHKQPQAPNQ